MPASLESVDGPLVVEVSYRFAEYRRIVMDAAPGVARQKGNLEAVRVFEDGSRLSRWGILLLMAPLFLYKKLRLGTCRFEFDAEGFRRLSKGHGAKRAWTDVVRVQILKEAYLIQLKEGALPLPFRVFSSAQREHLETLVPAGKLG